ncbi:PREDICTED: uncharacterized protein LOC108555836 [Eufriesea mexicana]|uniref:uncharacterized protein LOC108555836 n=1 Tax=Eufriesea mexicana TaxID=516756 RepID=UPI00083C6B84|nr:PREDICTED: uncharacterized protein LOC108555836 [Eufriesea mexicana]
MSSPHYCIWGLCDSQQYCCGDNVCCNEADFNSLFLPYVHYSFNPISCINNILLTKIHINSAFIAGTIIIITLCCIAFIILERIGTPFLKKYFKVTYTLMSTELENKVNTTTNQESIMKGCVV